MSVLLEPKIVLLLESLLEPTRGSNILLLLLRSNAGMVMSDMEVGVLDEPKTLHTTVFGCRTGQ